jgi:hypothetical protein
MPTRTFSFDSVTLPGFDFLTCFCLFSRADGLVVDSGALAACRLDFVGWVLKGFPFVVLLASDAADEFSWRLRQATPAVRAGLCDGLLGHRHESLVPAVVPPVVRPSILSPPLPPNGDSR